MTMSTLEKLLEESKQSNSELLFAFDNLECIKCNNLDFSLDSLVEIEKVLRDLHRNRSYSKDIDLELIERLVWLYLGQCLINIYDGSWHIYKGKFHVMSPFVIKISSNGCIDHRPICTDIATSEANGRFSGKVLYTYANNALKIAQPL